MSFKCDHCQQTQETGTKPTKVVTQVRNTKYTPIRDEKGNVTRIPTGQEIVKEISVCSNCADEHDFYVEVVEDKELSEI